MPVQLPKGSRSVAFITPSTHTADLRLEDGRVLQWRAFFSQAALREVVEETGITPPGVISQHSGFLVSPQTRHLGLRGEICTEKEGDFIVPCICHLIDVNSGVKLRKFLSNCEGDINQTWSGE